MKEFLMIIVVMFVPLGISILLLTGKISAADAISGYNTMNKKKKEKYDEKVLSRFSGWMLLLFCLSFIIFLIAGMHLKGAWVKYCGVTLVLSFFVCIIYANTSKRFRKKMAKEKE